MAVAAVVVVVDAMIVIPRRIASCGLHFLNWIMRIALYGLYYADCIVRIAFCKLYYTGCRKITSCVCIMQLHCITIYSVLRAKRYFVPQTDIFARKLKELLCRITLRNKGQLRAFCNVDWRKTYDFHRNCKFKTGGVFQKSPTKVL